MGKASRRKRQQRSSSHGDRTHAAAADVPGPAGRFAAILVESENARPERHAWRLRRARVTVASASGREGQPVHGEKVVSWLSKVFELNPAGLNWPRAVLFLDVALVPLVVFWAIGYEQ